MNNSVSPKPVSLVKNFSWKFYVGIILIVVSLTAGGVLKIFLLLYLNHPILWWTFLIAYFLTWPMLILGIWWAGKEYADKIKRYVSYRFYHESLKEGTRRVAVHARNKTKQFAVNARARTKKFHDQARIKTAKLKEQVKNRLSRVKLRRKK